FLDEVNKSQGQQIKVYCLLWQMEGIPQANQGNISCISGIVGSVLAKDGRVSDLSDLFGGAFKIVWKQLRRDDSPSSTSKPRNDTLMAQVNSLRQELQILASSRPVTIVTGSGSGGTKYGMVIVIVVLGYGYVWWKGWKLPDMMFATRRSLSDACNSVAKQLETATKKHLSSRIDRVDCNLDECAELNASTKEEVSLLHEDMKEIGGHVQNVHLYVQSLETKLSRIEGKQEQTNQGVSKLVGYAWHLENSRTLEASPSSSSRQAIESPQTTPSRSESLPSALMLEPPSPSTANGSSKVVQPIEDTTSAPGLKEFRGISQENGASSSSPMVSNGSRVPEVPNGSSSAGILGRVPRISGSFLSRTRSATQSFK
ncbi:protein of unknown function DUF1664, partial [Dillenia turbinata]